MESKVETIIQEQQTKIERISGYTEEQAKEVILNRMEQELTHEKAMMIKAAENEVKETANKQAKNILSLALQRLAADHVAETTVSVVNLSNDEMKGSIIGSEGRYNINMETLHRYYIIFD